MNLIDLSHTIASGMDQYPGDDPPVTIIRQSDHGPGSHRSSALAFGCHVGTHVDTPLHFLAGQPGLEVMPLALFCGSAQVVDINPADTPIAIGPESLARVNLNTSEYLILRTGWEHHWGTPRYYEEWPSLAPATARILADAGLKGVGLDSPSVDPLGEHRCHEILAAAGMINVENLANLMALPAGNFTLLVMPLKLTDAEASPVRAAAIV